MRLNPWPLIVFGLIVLPFMLTGCGVYNYPIYNCVPQSPPAFTPAPQSTVITLGADAFGKTITVTPSTLIHIAIACHGSTPAQSIAATAGGAVDILSSGYNHNRSAFDAVLSVNRPGVETIEFTRLSGEACCAPPPPLIVIVPGGDFTPSTLPAVLATLQFFGPSQDDSQIHWQACTYIYVYRSGYCPLTTPVSTRLIQLVNYIESAPCGEQYLSAAPFSSPDLPTFTFLAVHLESNGNVTIVIQRPPARPDLTVTMTQQLDGTWLASDLASGTGPSSSIFSSPPNC